MHRTVQPCEAMGFHSIFVDDPAAIGEKWQSIEHREQRVSSTIILFSLELRQQDASLGTEILLHDVPKE